MLYQSKAQYHFQINASGVTSQVTRDGFAGYRKYGINLGLGILKPLKGNKKLLAEFNFCNKGSRQRVDISKGNYTDYKLFLNYLDIPFAYIFPKYGVNFELGLTPSFLLSFNEVQNNINVLSYNPFKKIELLGFGGVIFEISDQLHFKIRYQHSMTPLRSPDVPDGYYWFQLGQYHSVIQVGLQYFLKNPGFSWGYVKKEKFTEEGK